MHSGRPFLVSELQKLSVDRPYVMYAAYDLTIHGSQNPLSHSPPLEGNNALSRNQRSILRPAFPWP